MTKVSVWTTLEGELKIPTEAHFSIKKWVKENLYSGEFRYKGEVDSRGWTEFTLTFCLDGIEAAEFIEHFMRHLPRGAVAHLESNIRWLN